MKNMLKTTAAIGSTEIVLMFLALFKNKYLAMTIGPEGFGIYGILLSFFNLMAVFSGAWLATGATKYISEYNSQNKNNDVSKVISFSIGLTTVISIFIMIILICFNEIVLKLFLSKEITYTHYILFTGAFIGNSLRPVFMSIFQGLKQIKMVVIYRIVVSVLEMLAIVVFVYLMGLTGYFFGIFISSLTIIVVFMYLNRKRKIEFSLQIVLIDEITKKLLLFGGINLFLTFINLGGLYIQRKIILSNLDLIAVGYLQAAISIRNYSDIVGRASGFYFLPRMSEKIDNAKRNREINNYLFFSMIIYIIIGTVILLFRDVIIRLLLTEAFIYVGTVIPWFIIAEYFNNVNRPFGQTIVGMARLRLHTINCVIVFVSWVIIPYILVPKIGIVAIAVSSIVGSLISMINSMIFLKINNNIIITTRNVLLFMIGFSILLFVAYLDLTAGLKILLLGIILISLPLFISNNEKSIIKNMLNGLMKW
jgi:O-antigen/teichoic acid export membrane protein